MTRLLPFVIVAASCTPQQVHTFAEQHGIPLTDTQAVTVAGWLTRDCLPAYDSPTYVECAVKDAAVTYGVDVDVLAGLVWCESRFDPDAVNRRSGATGLAQFLEKTWEWVQSLGAPYAHLPRTHARANAFTAAWLIARPELGGIDHWVCAP